MKTMKILHILYSGLGGHGNVFFSMVDADKEKAFKYEVLFFGVEEVRAGYIENAEAKNIPWYFVKKKPGFDIALYDDYAKYAAIDGWLRPGRVLTGVYKGYYPNSQLNNFETLTNFGTSKKLISVTQTGLQLLESCISLCKKNNVKLVLVMAPYFKQYSPEKYFTNFNAVVDSVKTVANQSDIPFFDYTKMSIVDKKQYFYNFNHLNSLGADVYTKAVSDTIKKYFSGL